MSSSTPKFRIYPPLGIARLGNGPAVKDQVVFSPEVPWENLYSTDLNYLTGTGEIKKQAQRFYIYECDDLGRPMHLISNAEYDIQWSVEVANKKPYWYVFNNCLDLSVVSDNYNLSPTFYKEEIAPARTATQRNPNTLDQSQRVPSGHDYRKELINHPPKVTVTANCPRQVIHGQFPYPLDGESQLAKSMNIPCQPVDLGTIEYDEDGTLIFYAADGVSASLNPSDLNTDFADNSNWYDDICDGRVTAVITSKATSEQYCLVDAQAAAWVATAPPDYAPQIQPLATMYDMVAGTDTQTEYQTDLSLIFPFLYSLYRMQWVNLGDFLAPSFTEMIDQITAQGDFQYLYQQGPDLEKGMAIRQQIFEAFRDPLYPYNNEPVIPSNQNTSIENRGSGTSSLKFPYYPGDGVDYPGSPAQWFAIPPLLYQQFEQWREGHFVSPPGDYANMDALGRYYQAQFCAAAQDPARRPFLMTLAIFETLYGGGFHPGVELTWPMRHRQIYAENEIVFADVTPGNSFYGLREVRLNAASEAEQAEIFYNDFGFLMSSADVQASLDPENEKHWLWRITPGDLTKWMGIPWQSDAGSCQAVYTEQEYPIPAWWAATLPVFVLPEDSYQKLEDATILENTRRNIYANRLAWLHTSDLGYVGYHASGSYTDGLINMVYKWENMGMVTGRKLQVPLEGIPEILYVALSPQQTDD
ncbi:MAG: LodA/GoxA family CTQ-dependent oxidase [Cyanobacteria bacterium P01_G01_bin.54]